MMFNVPLPGGTTGHAVCGTLVAILFGPWAATIAVSIALAIQAVFFGDGGILAFGANCFNMAFVLPLLGYTVYKLIAGKNPDLNRELVEHPASTFYARVAGDSMEGEGISEGDLLVVDRSLEAEHGDLAVCCLDGEFTLKRLRFLPGGGLVPMPSNPRYRPIPVASDADFKVWGVVVFTIKANRRRRRGAHLW